MVASTLTDPAAISNVISSVLFKFAAPRIPPFTAARNSDLIDGLSFNSLKVTPISFTPSVMIVAIPLACNDGIGVGIGVG